jgi:hypothetical protein
MTEKFTTNTDKPLAVFLTGVQCRKITSMWKIPMITNKMIKMQSELKLDKKAGFYHGENFFTMTPHFTTLFLSYWDSPGSIERFANSKFFSHLESAKDYLKNFLSDTNLGIWHETFVVEPEKVESLYYNMEPFGLSAFQPHQKLTSLNYKFKQRINIGEEENEK